MKRTISLVVASLAAFAVVVGVAGAASSPTVATGAATTIRNHSAVLNGSVNPNGASTQYWFVWGPTTAYGGISAHHGAGNGGGDGSGGGSGGAGAQTATPIGTVPPPTLTALQVPLAINVTWSAIPEATTTGLARSLDGQTWTALSTSGTAYLDRAISPTTMCLYRLSASGPGGSAVSDPASTTSLAPPLAPALTTQPVPLSTIVGWTTMPGAQTYSIQRGATPAALVTIVTTIDQSVQSYSDETGLTPGTAYYYTLSGQNGADVVTTPIAACYSAGPVPVTPTRAQLDPLVGGVVDLWWPPAYDGTQQVSAPPGLQQAAITPGGTGSGVSCQVRPSPWWTDCRRLAMPGIACSAAPARCPSASALLRGRNLRSAK